MIFQDPGVAGGHPWHAVDRIRMTVAQHALSSSSPAQALARVSRPRGSGANQGAQDMPISVSSSTNMEMPYFIRPREVKACTHGGDGQR